jgi:hypothetical protein
MPFEKRTVMLGRRVGGMTVVLICLSAARGSCGDNVWTGSGLLDGERVNSVAVDPLDARTVYAATFGGIFKSSDGGTRWERLNASGSLGYFEALAIHPTTPTTLYAAGCGGSASVVKTVDGGSSWTTASSGLNNTCVTTIAIDPLSPSTVFAGASSVGSPIGSGTEGVFRSTDGRRELAVHPVWYGQQDRPCPGDRSRQSLDDLRGC